MYLDYRKNCLKSAWLDKPQESLSKKIELNFYKWHQASIKIYPNHPLRLQEDINLIDKAVTILQNEYKNIKPEFQHAHLGDSDLIQTNNGIVVLSNLYWSWRAPYYDAIFSYHWHIYHLSNIKKFSPEKIEEQRDLWLKEINKLAITPQDQRLLKLALLERAAAGLNLDALSLDLNQPISKYLVEFTRSNLKILIKKISLWT